MNQTLFTSIYPKLRICGVWNSKFNLNLTGYPAGWKDIFGYLFGFLEDPQVIFMSGELGCRLNHRVFCRWDCDPVQWTLMVTSQRWLWSIIPIIGSESGHFKSHESRIAKNSLGSTMFHGPCSLLLRNAYVPHNKDWIKAWMMVNLENRFSL